MGTGEFNVSLNIYVPAGKWLDRRAIRTAVFGGAGSAVVKRLFLSGVDQFTGNTGKGAM